KEERTGSLRTAVAINGKRDEKSFPARVISRTPALSRRARMRKPSCLISCIQPGPAGGALAGDGKHGSIIPRPGRVRSRNDMGRSNSGLLPFLLPNCLKQPDTRRYKKKSRLADCSTKRD